MVGQETLREEMVECVRNNMLPKFMIFSGERGSGKRTFVQWFIRYFVDINDAQCVVFDDIRHDVSAIREMFVSAYLASNKAIYAVYDADKLSFNAIQALLKFTEDPPGNAYIIMTVQNIYMLPNTLRSRAVVFSMLPYTKDELRQFAYSVSQDEETIEKMVKIAVTIGDVKMLAESGFNELVSFVEKVVDYIAKASIGNAFKIADKIALKKDADGYDLVLFWKVFMFLCRTRALSKDVEESWKVRYVNAVLFTAGCEKQTGIIGINRSMLFDNWILGIRSIWM